MDATVGDHGLTVGTVNERAQANDVSNLIDGGIYEEFGSDETMEDEFDDECDSGDDDDDVDDDDDDDGSVSATTEGAGEGCDPATVTGEGENTEDGQLQPEAA